VLKEMSASYNYLFHVSFDVRLRSLFYTNMCRKTDSSQLGREQSYMLVVDIPRVDGSGKKICFLTLIILE
jgi:hypothetical protein